LRSLMGSLLFSVVAVIITTVPAFAQLTLQQIDGSAVLVASDGKYIGRISSNAFDTESICNDFGDYGNPFSANSVKNQFGDYGNPFSSISAYNQFTSAPPAIIYNGRVVGYLTKNQFVRGAVDPDVLLAVYRCPKR
jgi:hypothetical protein